MANQQFRPGDRVIPRDGGRVMTVECVGRDGCECAWFEGTLIQRETFPPDALTFHTEEFRREGPDRPAKPMRPLSPTERMTPHG